MHKKILYTLLFLVIMSSALAAIGKIKSPDPNEIKDEQIEQSFELNSAQRLRFNYDGTEVNIRVRGINPERANFSIYSSGYEYNQQITLDKFDKFSFDVNNDNTIDFSIVLENITLSATKKRVNITFTTDFFPSSPEPAVESPEPIEEEVIVEEPVVQEGQDDVEQEEYVIINQEAEPAQPQATAISGTAFNQIATFVVLLIVVGFAVGLYVMNKHKDKLF